MKTVNRYSALIILFFFLGVLNLGAGCNPMPQDQKKSGDAVTQVRNVGDFTGIRVGGAFEVYLTQGTTNSVSVQADKDIIDDIETKVSGGTLEINMKGHGPWHNNTGPLNVFVTYKDINNLDLSGAVEIETKNKMSVNDLALDVSGAVEAKLELAVQKLSMDISGAGELKLSGSAGVVRIDGSGASEVDAYELSSNDVAIYGSGAMEVNMTVNNTLMANLSGACTVKYKGNPKVDVNSSGACIVKRAE